MRSAGILLHPTCLPSPYGVGDLGLEAYRFVDLLHRNGLSHWQVLPLGIPDETGSPYASPSAFAGSPLLVSPVLLYRAGWLEPKQLPKERPIGPVRFPSAERGSARMLGAAFANFRARADGSARTVFDAFRKRESWWLEDVTLYQALHFRFGKTWQRWPTDVAHRDPRSIHGLKVELADALEFFAFVQWVFDAQWSALRSYANRRGVRILGDLPFFLRLDSADAWVHPELFRLNARNAPSAVAGAPPDRFARRGQIWNAPLYRWSEHRRSGFRWWRSRMRRAAALYDELRLDHFRGYRAVWAIPVGARTARRGQWDQSPGEQLLQAFRSTAPRLRLIAEDLGAITADVHALRQRFRIPGTRVLLFELRDLTHVNQAVDPLPKRMVLYTGTHDTQTLRGWLDSLPRRERNGLLRSLRCSNRQLPAALLRIGAESKAETFLVPLPDVLELGNRARMNTPGTPRGNWSWRFRSWPDVSRALERFGRIARSTGRVPPKREAHRR